MINNTEYSRKIRDNSFSISLGRTSNNKGFGQAEPQGGIIHQK